MIYLAVLLILSGLLIVIASLYIERAEITSTGKNRADKGMDDDPEHPVFPEPDDMDIIFPDKRSGDLQEFHNQTDEEDIFISFDDDLNAADKENDLPVNDDWGIEKDNEIGAISEKAIVNIKEDKSKNDEILPDTEATFTSVSAVMFDDRSNIIDYEAGEGVIDSTFAKYKSIKRIGKGKLDADADGLNFFLGEKLYRFDFHKVYDIWSGNNYVALPLKGSSNVKLFLIENPRGFPEKVELYFKEYEKGL